VCTEALETAAEADPYRPRRARQISSLVESSQWLALDSEGELEERSQRLLKVRGITLGAYARVNNLDHTQINEANCVREVFKAPTPE